MIDNRSTPLSASMRGALEALARFGEIADRTSQLQRKERLTAGELRDLVFSVGHFRMEGRVDDLHRVVGLGMQIANEAGWKKLLAELANIQGMNELLKCQPDQAKSFFEQAVQGWAEEAVPEEYGRSLINLAQVCFDMGETGAAKESLAKALDLARSLNLPRLEAQTLGFIGAVLFYHDASHAEAYDAYQQARKLYAAIDDKRGEQKIANYIERLETERGLISYEVQGVPREEETPLYRGEGRLKVDQGWHSNDYDQLASHFRKTGFRTRDPDGQFSGTLSNQILQQGYIDQNTVSLTASMDVARYYALGGNMRDRGVVFTIDTARLRKHGEVYDSYASMRRSLSWFFASDFGTLVQLVKALDVAGAGAFLQRCDHEVRQRVESARDLVAPPPSWPGRFGPEQWEQLCNVGLSKEHLDSFFDAIRGFWLKASDGRSGYYWAFRAVQNRLCQAQARATEEHKRNPGWQTSPFGYVAKTCRDQEFFSSGSVPGECIVEAVTVSRNSCS